MSSKRRGNGPTPGCRAVRLAVGALFVAQLSTAAAAGDGAGAPEPSDPESSAVAEAFARLGALQRYVAELLRALPGDRAAHGRKAESAPAPDDPCGSREEMNEALGEIDDRHDVHAEAIVRANEELRDFREDLLDIDEICESALAEGIASAESRLRSLGVVADRTAVGAIAICIDGLRERTDGELERAATDIRTRRLAAEMERLTAITERAMELERALLRGVSKRDRIVEELGQFRQEIERACL